MRKVFEFFTLLTFTSFNVLWAWNLVVPYELFLGTLWLGFGQSPLTPFLIYFLSDRVYHLLNSQAKGVTVASVKRRVRKFTFSEVAWDLEWFITVIWCFMLYSVNKVVEIKSQHQDDKYCDILWKRWRIIIGFLSTSSWPLQMTKRWKMRWERKRIFCSTLAHCSKFRIFVEKLHFHMEDHNWQIWIFMSKMQN